MARTKAREDALRLEDPDLAYFLQGTPEFEAYVRDMLWAQDYAMAKRAAMMDQALTAFFGFVGTGQELDRITTPVLACAVGPEPLWAIQAEELCSRVPSSELARAEPGEDGVSDWLDRLS